MQTSRVAGGGNKTVRSQEQREKLQPRPTADSPRGGEALKAEAAQEETHHRIPGTRVRSAVLCFGIRKEAGPMRQSGLDFSLN